MIRREGNGADVDELNTVWVLDSGLVMFCYAGPCRARFWGVVVRILRFDRYGESPGLEKYGAQKKYICFATHAHHSPACINGLLCAWRLAPHMNTTQGAGVTLRCDPQTHM